MAFPIHRMRRMRNDENTRRLVRETSLTVNDLIMPLFVCPGKNIKNEISSMPGNYHMSVDVLVDECKKIRELRIPGIILFGLPEAKDLTGSDSFSETGIIQQALKALKREVKDLLIITDVCFCEYTSHGHCGVLEHGSVNNDATLELLGKQALSHVEAGADMIAPSDMMDGRVGVIRSALDSKGFKNIPIMAYSAKYSSAFYGPFREAADSAPQEGDRKGYQMDPANSDEAVRETRLDIEEGADIVMVKPALSYLDVIYRIKQEFKMPVAAYNVSGEYAMIQAAARNGWIDGDKVTMEVLTSIKRAGADIILTYSAKDAARILNQKDYI
ncbi:MAG: porphobilinogen synthase [Spirochaetia bacterium]|jgi:porphobilinogen synthase|nr:porphobilinogen synthase [Spirochaetia bacterium]